jgi:trehalose/maltose transport system permease protein
MATTITAGAALPAAVKAAPPSRLTRQRTRAAWLFLAPMLLVLGAVAIWPLGRTIWFAFTDANLSDLSAAQFVGLNNFVYLLSDPEWWQAVRNTMLFAVISVTIETVLGLLIAPRSTPTSPAAGVLRAAVLIPWAIPTWSRPRCGRGCSTTSSACSTTS